MWLVAATAMDGMESEVKVAGERLMGWIRETLMRSVVGAKDIPDVWATLGQSERVEVLENLVSSATLSLLNPILVARFQDRVNSKRILLCGPHGSLSYQERLVRSVESLQKTSFFYCRMSASVF